MDTLQVLSGKKVLFIGDSITAGMCDYDCPYPYTSTGWAGRIGYHYQMEEVNNGVSCACISNHREEDSSDLYIYNQLIAEQENTYDYIIIQGLYNDAAALVPLGTVCKPEEFEPEKARKHKFIDSLELMIYIAKEQHPNAQIGYIVNFKTIDGAKLDAYVKAAIEVCEAWDVPYLDLYNDKQFSISLMDDGCHPSSKGYEETYSVIADWMAAF